MPSVSIWKERVTMKIILLSDVKNVGKKGEVKEVADGYGRNYLIRNHLAVEATRKSMEILEKQKADDKDNYTVHVFLCKYTFLCKLWQFFMQKWTFEDFLDSI